MTTARPHILGWAFYVAVSWTWCIGMFLPVILLRDLGIWSFPAFALPNILGAASVGFLMKSPDSSRRLLTEHAAAVWAFSAVTIAFQVFFAAWIFSALGGWKIAPGWLAPAAAAVILCVLPGRFRPVWLLIAAVLWLMSVAVLARTVMLNGPPALPPDGLLPTAEVWPLAMVCALGFGACPFLDATFHRARIETRGSSKAAFGIGFGLLFPVMILGTLAVSGLLLPIAHGTPLTTVALLVLAAHLVPQLLFTIRAHAMEFDKRLPLTILAALILATILVLPLLSVKYPWLAHGDLTLGEIIYRSFMAAYGLAFPAYVLICMTPVTSGTARVTAPTRVRIRWWLLAVALASPFYWRAFIDLQTWLVVPGIVIVLAAMIGARESTRLAARRAERQ